MDYLKIYNRIVARGKMEKREKGKGIYYEAHHIIPKCMGGDGLVTGWRRHPNIVLLTAKEHFLCHLILHRLFPNNHKLGAAIALMVDCNKDNRYKVSIKLYEEICKTKSEICRIKATGFKHTEEAKRKMSEVQKGKPKKRVHKMTEEHKSMLTKLHLGIPLSQEHKDKIGKALKGRKLDKDKYRHTFKGVKQWSMDWVFLKDWESSAEASRNVKNANHRTIAECCKNKRKSHCNYRWTYIDEKNIPKK